MSVTENTGDKPTKGSHFSCEEGNICLRASLVSDDQESSLTIRANDPAHVVHCEQFSRMLLQVAGANIFVGDPPSIETDASRRPLPGAGSRQGS